LDRSLRRCEIGERDWVGRVFDSVSETTLEDWKFDGGVGFRLAWNLSTVISFDYGRSTEGSLFFMELGHQF